MTFTELSLAGMYEITPKKLGDNRGYFARVFCEDLFAEQGLETRITQMNISMTAAKGSLRGLHFQRPPRAEAKLIRAMQGEVWDVALDLRKGSETYGQVAAVTLSAEAGNAVYIPPGCAHGFQTLTPDAMLHYAHTEPYAPELEGGVNPLDPELAIDWPLPVAEMSERDRALPNFKDVDPI